MKLLIDLDTLKNFKSRDLLPLECEVCSSKFYKTKNLVQRGIKGTRKLNVCSEKCRKTIIGNLNKISCRKYPETIDLKCTHCDKPFKRTYRIYIRQVKNNKKQYCSQSCSSSNQRSTQNNRSTIELWLEEKLKNKYPNLDLLFNVRNVLVKCELDIYIPSLNLAFEINGAYHYKPIYGEKELVKRKEKDLYKKTECKNKKINLYIIDMRNYSNLRKSEKDLYQALTKISNIIENGAEAR